MMGFWKVGALKWCRPPTRSHPAGSVYWEFGVAAFISSRAGECLLCAAVVLKLEAYDLGRVPTGNRGKEEDTHVLASSFRYQFLSLMCFVRAPLPSD